MQRELDGTWPAAREFLDSGHVVALVTVQYSDPRPDDLPGELADLGVMGVTGSRAFWANWGVLPPRQTDAREARARE